MKTIVIQFLILLFCSVYQGNLAKETSDCKECEKKVSENNVEIGITKGLHKLLNETLHMFIENNKSEMFEIRKQLNDNLVQKNHQIDQINSHLDEVTSKIASIESKMEKEKKELQEKINEQIKNNHDDIMRLTNDRFDSLENQIKQMRSKSDKNEINIKSLNRNPHLLSLLH